MEKIQAQNSSKKLNAESFSLIPSTLITLFEIDVTDIAFDKGIISDADILNQENYNIFRFHNNVKLIDNSIYFKDKEYIAAPITADGFEITSKGTLPTPKLALSVNDQGINALSILKTRIKQLGDLIGAKIIRIRTFGKYLDRKNFLDQIVSDEFDPDSFVEFPRDIYYIDRKSNENKYTIEFELSSVLDVEGIKLPSRLVTEKKCPFQYRGDGCLYEYKTRRVEAIHGKEIESTLPDVAIPVANDRDELIKNIINANIVDKGKYEPNFPYVIGHGVYIEKGGIKYYFVAKINNPPAGPPNLRYWIADQCSKTIRGDKLRWKNIGNGHLRFGGFSAVNGVL
jgi:lambda family phage minor tail protein L